MVVDEHTGCVCSPFATVDAGVVPATAGMVYAPMVAVDGYVWTPEAGTWTSSPSPFGWVSFTFVAKSATTVHFEWLIIAPDSQSDSFYVQAPLVGQRSSHVCTCASTEITLPAAHLPCRFSCGHTGRWWCRLYLRVNLR